MPVTRIVSYPYNLVGILVIAFGVYIFLSAAKLFGREKTDIHPKGRPSFFIKTGPYRYSRNPIYLGMVTVAFGVAVVLGSLAAFIAPLIVFVVISLLVIPYEEKTLKEVFGEDYEGYKKQVRRWI